MSNVRSYLKEKEKRSQKQNNHGEFTDRIRKHRMSIFYRIILVCALLVTVGAVVFIQYRDKQYSQMTQISTKQRKAVAGARDVSLGDNLVTYSNDGISCMNSKGDALWNQTYEMQNPIIATCKDILAVADYNGRKIYVMNSEKKLGEISTNLPIRNLCVASNGVVMSVQEEGRIAWIYIYDSQGKELVYFRTTMSDTGYPTAISLSDNAKLAGVAYTYVEAGVLQTRVAFYNFGGVGENQIDNLVSGYNYSDTIVPYIHFVNSETALAVADNRIMIYSGNEVPETKMERLLDEEIQAVYSSDKYIGLVFINGTGESSYVLKVLNLQGEEVVAIPFDFSSISDAGVVFSEDIITIYNEKECLVYNVSGKQKFAGTFEKTVRTMIPISGTFRYVLAYTDSIDVVELK